MPSFYGKVIFVLDQIGNLVRKAVIEDTVVSDTSVLMDQKPFQRNLEQLTEDQHIRKRGERFPAKPLIDRLGTVQFQCILEIADCHLSF